MGEPGSMNPNLAHVAIVLTFNAERSLSEVLRACQSVASRTLVVDSGSADSTEGIAGRAGCDLLVHTFENYAEQRNWAQAQAARMYDLGPDDWVLHVDADEVVSPELAAQIQRVLALPRDQQSDGYLVQRLSYFLGRPIRYGHINPSWHLRLFRVGAGQCEDRLYDQHFILSRGCRTSRLKGLLRDLQLTTLENWTAAHNRWSTAEAHEVSRRSAIGSRDSSGILPSRWWGGDIRMKKRWLKDNVWYRCPLLVRPLMFFLYTYFLRLGFLDGKAGLIYHFLQAFWFRFLVDAKLYESRIKLSPGVVRDPAGAD